MKRLVAVLAAPFAFHATPAVACYDGSNVTAYFSYGQPERHGDTVMLVVHVLQVDRDEGGADAVLDGPLAALSPDGRVRIEFGEPPLGANCIVLGPTDGPVAVIGTLARATSGALTLYAVSTRSERLPRGPRGGYDQYIVDPAYRRAPAQRGND